MSTKKTEERKIAYQQGDVLLLRVEKIPETMQKVKSKILQYGESTGHKHQFDANSEVSLFLSRKGAQEFKANNFRTITDLAGDKYIEVLAPAVLRHETHGHQLIDPGLYRLDIVREMADNEEVIRVTD